MDDGVQTEPDWDMAAQPAPGDEVDQRINWWLSEAAISTASGSRCERSNCLG